MTDQWPVVLDELDREGAIRVLSLDEAQLLSTTRLVGVRDVGGGRFLLTSRGMVGAVRIGVKQIQVNPKGKVRVAHLLFLLGYAENPGFRPEDVEGALDDELWPALAESLARQVEGALRHGVLQGYRTHDEALRTIRGRIRMGDQLTRRPGRLLPVEVSYDDFTIDTTENRIMRSALRRMLAVPHIDQSVRKRLRHLDVRLEGATVLGPGARIPQWVSSRHNIPYQSALRLAEIVLRNASAHSSPGGISVASFVVPMWKVFEEFVVTALREALRSAPGHTQAHYQCFLDESGGGQQRGDIRLDVDLVHLNGERFPTAVFDAKYKASSDSGRYANADHYQMLAYCTALEVPVAYLVYAQGGSKPRRRSIRHSSVLVIEYPLDLAAPPSDLLAQIQEVAGMSLSEIPRTNSSIEDR